AGMDFVSNSRGTEADAKHLQTVTGTGDDAREYTIHGYKKLRKVSGGEWVEESFISVIQTDDGREAWCVSEDPLEFWIRRTSITVRCDRTNLKRYEEDRR